MARKPISPDAGLLCSVFRYAGGANIHVLFSLADQYQNACANGHRFLACQIETTIRRKMLEGYKHDRR